MTDEFTTDEKAGDSNTATARLAFVLGLIAGEGSFHLTFTRDDRRRYDLAYGVRFQMGMGVFAEDTLTTARNMVGVGRVRETDSGYVWIISNRREAHRLRTIIDNHLAHHDSPFVVTSKHRSYQHWTEALELLRPGHRLSESEIRQLVVLKGEMNRIPDTGRSTEELLAIIDEANAELR